METTVPKICGADAELGNFITGTDSYTSTCGDASRLLLRQVDGVDSWGVRSGNSFQGHARDWGRRFLPSNGGCIYIDLDHLELCTPEVRSAPDFVAAWHAMLRIVQKAQSDADALLPDGHRIEVMVNNSDGSGNSYGSHLNFLLTRRAWDNIFERKLHYLLSLAAFQISSIVITGQGKVGAENGSEPAEFQLSQRADFIETLTGVQTTFNRPVVNSRDESCCGSGLSGLARLHVIFYDSNLCHVANYLKVGILQIFLAQLEAEQCTGSLILDDPIAAVKLLSRDPSLQQTVRLADGRSLSALNMQEAFLESAVRFVDGGHCEGLVPEASTIVSLWADTITLLRRRDYAQLRRRLDWVLKLSGLLRAMETRNLNYTAPQLRHLDQVYSSLRVAEGLYWAYERAGQLDLIASEEAVSALCDNPPRDTRAWTRAMLLRTPDSQEIDHVDWDAIEFLVPARYGFRSRRKVAMANPSGHTEQEMADVLGRHQSLQGALEELADTTSMPSSSVANDNATHATGTYVDRIE